MDVRNKCPQLNLSTQEIKFLEKYKDEAAPLIVNLDKHIQKLDKCR